MVTLLKVLFIMTFATATRKMEVQVMEAEAQQLQIELELEKLQAEEDVLELVPAEEE